MLDGAGGRAKVLLAKAEVERLVRGASVRASCRHRLRGTHQLVVTGDLRGFDRFDTVDQVLHRLLHRVERFGGLDVARAMLADELLHEGGQLAEAWIGDRAGRCRCRTSLLHRRNRGIRRCIPRIRSATRSAAAMATADNCASVGETARIRRPSCSSDGSRAQFGEPALDRVETAELGLRPVEFGEQAR